MTQQASARPAVSPAPSPGTPAVVPPKPVAPITPKPQLPKPRVAEPEFTEYTIQRGDTFESIARKFYGDSSLKSAISRANPYNSTDLLKPGRIIRVPKDPRNIQGLPIGPDPVPVPSVAPDPAPVAPASPAAAPRGGKKYTIQAEDTIWGISKKFYGKGALHKVIAEANRDKIPDPNDLPVGMEIFIPDQPER